MFVMKGLEPARTPYGKPRFATRKVLCAGDLIKVFYPPKNLRVGQKVTLSPPGYDRPGVVISTHADDPRYQNAELCGGYHKNTGEGFYIIEVQEIPD